jgi:hypothetical protein
MDQSVPKRRHLKLRRRGITKRNNTIFKTRRKFEIKKSRSVLVEGKRETKRALGRPGSKWEVNTTIFLKCRVSLEAL